jgi:hypothetical protein
MIVPQFYAVAIAPALLGLVQIRASQAQLQSVVAGMPNWHNFAQAQFTLLFTYS